MKPDFYTKAVLTIIAIMVTVIGCNQYVSPKATAQAQGGQFAGVQFAYSGVYYFFDTKTGEVWTYNNSSKQWYTHERITQLGGRVIEVPATTAR